MCEGDGMEEWKECTLSDLGTIVGGATPSTKDSSNYENGSIAWITPKDLSAHTERFISHGERNITEKGLKSCSAQLMPPNSILFTSRAPIGYIAIAKNEVCTNQGFKSIIPNKDTDFMFLYYLLRYNKDNIENLGSGTTFKEVSGSTMRNVPVKVPPLPTQQKIAAILSSLDDKIELNNKINTNLEQQAQAFFKNWFVDFEPFGGKMPEGWKEIPLEELCTVVTKGTTPTTLGKKFTEVGINFIKGESILDNHTFDLQKISHIDDETNLMLKRSIIQPNDILFTIAGTLGRFAFIDETLTPANTNQAVGIIRANLEIISPYYLYSFFIGNWHNDYYTKRIQQAVQANLSLGTIKSLPIIIPDSQNLNKYTNLIEPLFRQMKQLENENIKLSTLRDTLLPKLMNGEIEM